MPVKSKVMLIDNLVDQYNRGNMNSTQLRRKIKTQGAHLLNSRLPSKGQPRFGYDVQMPSGKVRKF